MNQSDRLIKTGDVFIMTILVFVALFTRLWLVHNPDYVVFDEVHFGNFTNWYVKREYFFDIHPPLGKLIMAGIAKLSGYHGNINFNRKSGHYAMNEINYVSLRITPCVFQSFCFPMIYAALRCIGISEISSVTATTLLMFDTCVLAEGKYILSDGMLHFFTCLHILCSVLLIKRQRTINELLTGITLGFAISCKNTALGLYAFTGLIQLVWVFSEQPSLKRMTRRATFILSPSFLVFICSFILHIIICKYDGMGNKYVSIETQNTILNSTKYSGQRLLGPPILARIAELNYVMMTGNMKIDTPHISQSSPINWPLLLDKWVIFLSANGFDIRCGGSPFVFYPSTIAIFVGLVLIITKKVGRRNTFLIAGWAASYAPFVLIPRSMYLYHYIIPLIFAVMELGSLVDELPSIPKRILCIILIGWALFWLLYFKDLVCGIPSGALQSRTWLRRWSEGPPRSVPLDYDGTTTVMYGFLPE